MNNKAATILEVMRRVRALAQNGLAYSDQYFDRERYQELYELSTQGIGILLDADPAHLFLPHDSQLGYATPKVGCRGALFKDGEILLVQEREDGLWSLPGGWVDVNDSPTEAITKEFLQETGLLVRPFRLCLVADLQKRGHISAHHNYSFVFLCEYISGSLTTSYETTAVQYFPLSALPPLSFPRTAPEYITAAWAHYTGQHVETEFD